MPAHPSLRKTSPAPLIFRALACLALLAVLVTPQAGATAHSAGPRAPTPPGCSSPGDQCWLGGFHFPGIPSGQVRAVAADALGNLYVGGDFIEAGGIEANNIARWDGVTWTDMGGGMIFSGGQDGGVYALALDGAGNLYAGGMFDTAGGVAAHNIARWNGSTWSALGDGVAGRVGVLEPAPGGSVYVGGWFSQAGGLATHGLARWDVDHWTIPGGGGVASDPFYEPEYDEVTALALDSVHDRLYAGGSFYKTAGNLAYIAVLDLTHDTWSGLGNGMDYPVGALALDTTGGLYAGGRPVGTAIGNIAYWNGAAWSGLGAGVTGGVVNALEFFSGSLYAAGDFTTAGGSAAMHLARWTPGPAAAWTALGSGAGQDVVYEQVYALASAGVSSLYVGGSFERAGGLRVHNLARWDTAGLAWSGADGTAAGFDVEVDALVVAGSEVYAGGRFGRAGRTDANGVARWDGTAWHALGVGLDYVHALEWQGGTLYAGGSFTTATGHPVSYIGSWNGSTWTALGGGVDGAVTALAKAGSGVLYAGGEFTHAGGEPASRVARWDGHAWHPLGDGVNGKVMALAVAPDGQLYAGGLFTSAGGYSAAHIARWDGSQWYPLGGANGYVYTLAFDSAGRLFVGGDFDRVGPGVQANGIALWNGVDWASLGSGLDGPATALAIDSADYVYAGGQFQAAGGAPARQIARWDGFAWSALGSGLAGRLAGYPVTEIAFAGDRLYVSGYFSVAGDKASTSFAAYHLPLGSSIPAPVLAELSPSSGLKNQGQALILSGVNFSSQSVVRWDGAALVTTYLSGTQLRAYLPAAKTIDPGAYPVTVYTPNGGTSSPLNFTVKSGMDIFIPLLSR